LVVSELFRQSQNGVNPTRLDFTAKLIPK